MSEWKDDKRGSTLNLSDFRVNVHRHIHYEKDDWLLSVTGMRVDCKKLDSKELEAAKDEAERMVVSILTKNLNELSRIAKEPKHD